MGARYLVSGVQLGLFKAMAELGDIGGISSMADDIVKKQYISDSNDTVEIDAKGINEFLILAHRFAHHLKTM